MKVPAHIGPSIRRLVCRCGPLSEATTARIQTLPLEQLESLADALLDFQGPDDLTTWLTSPSPPCPHPRPKPP